MDEDMLEDELRIEVHPERVSLLFNMGECLEERLDGERENELGQCVSQVMIVQGSGRGSFDRGEVTTEESQPVQEFVTLFPFPRELAGLQKRGDGLGLDQIAQQSVGLIAYRQNLGKISVSKGVELSFRECRCESGFGVIEALLHKDSLHMGRGQRLKWDELTA